MIQEESLFENQDYRKSIIKLTDLSRSDTPITSKIIMDESVEMTNSCFDFKFDGINKFYPFKMNKIIENLDFQILVITGSSGSGKSTFSRYFGEEESITWDNNKAIISNFSSTDEAVDKLSAVGLNSIPTWCKPRNVLSVGEGFRVDLARRLKSNCVIDEFTSTVDRNVAMSCSNSISKYIRRNNLQKCVFVSCHKDFIDVLCPDYVIDLDDECVYDTRGLSRRKFELQIYEKTNKSEIWKLFKPHHYLSSDLHTGSRVFVAYLDEQPVGFISILPQPGVKGLKYPAWRVHRLVILPDYQGLGIGTKLLEHICDLYIYHERNVYLRTSNFKLISYMKNSDKWEGDGNLSKSHIQTGILHHMTVKADRLSTSFKYIGPCKYDKSINYNCISFKDKNIEESITVTSLF